MILLLLFLFACSSPAPATDPDPAPANAHEVVIHADSGPGFEVPSPDVPCPSLPPLPAGCACEDNGSCASGWCATTASGRSCAAHCDDGCGPTEVCADVPGAAPRVCAPRFPLACLPCESDEACREGFVPLAHSCVPVGDGGTFCLPACGEDGRCPDTFLCGPDLRCQPPSDRCFCTPAAAASGREGLSGCRTFFEDLDRDLAGSPGRSKCLCEAHGTFRVTVSGDCDDSEPGVHPGAAETCDGRDEDCDGETDEDPAPAGDACPSVGVCAGTGGDPTCVLGAWRCLPPDLPGHEPGNETSCDGKDNDCDGETDETADCDDGLACTEDRCDHGACTHDVTDGACLVDGTCAAAGALSPDGPCRSCQPGENPGGWTPVANGSPCDADGDGCTRDDACIAGTCTAGPDVDCGSMAKGCATGTCTSQGPDAFQCALSAPFPDGTPCDDGEPCTLQDRCVDGTCTGNPTSCDDGLPCTDDGCDGTGGCLHTFRENTCLIAGTCALAGELRPGDPCRACLPGADPAAWSLLGDGSPCADDESCTFDETCKAGACIPAIVIPCDDGDPCTMDRCDPATQACVPEGLDCDDLDPCTQDDCDSTGCRHDPLPCDDGQPCTADSCSGGACVHVPVAQGTPCGGTGVCLGSTCASNCTLDPCPAGFGIHDGCHCPVPPTGLGLCSNGNQMTSCASIPPGQDYHGQDGHFPQGGPAFVDQGDGTVRDTRSDGVWSKSVSAPLSWAEAQAACQGNAAALPGEGWRLPEILELLGCVDYSRTSCPAWPAVLGTACPPGEWLWSGTPIGAGSTNLAVGFSTGYVTATSGKSAFRCVRGGLVGTAGTRFSSGEGIVLDRVAGLVWEGTPACTACTWKQALQVCTTRGPGWRVPTVKELLSLVDPSEDACPKWDPAFGPDCPSPSWFWSSTPVAASPNSAFYVSFNFGTANFTVFTGGYKAGVRCVRTAK